MSVAVTIDGTAIEVGVPITVTNGLDETPTATISIPRGSNVLNPAGRQPVAISLGYGATLVGVFAGETKKIVRSAVPTLDTVPAEGVMSRATLQLGTRRAYSNLGSLVIGGWTDETIVANLLAGAGIGYSVRGEGRTLVTQKPLIVTDSQPVLGIVKRIAKISNCIVYETGGLVVYAPWPATVSDPGLMDWIYVEGTPGVSLVSGQGYILGNPKPQRTRDLGQQKTRVKVLGYTYPQPHATYFNRPHACLTSGAAPWNTEAFEDDLIETTEHAATVAGNLFSHLGGFQDEITHRIQGNPEIRPGHVVGILSALLQVPTLTPYVVAHYQHTHTAAQFMTDLRLVKPFGASGSAVQDIRAIPIFSHTGAVSVTCNGALSQDWNGGVGGLSFEWFNDQNATALSGQDKVDFAVAFRDVEWAAAPQVFLTVRNADGLGAKLGAAVG